MVLIRQLIRDPAAKSAFAAAAAPDVAAVNSWTPTDYLLADLFDLTAQAHFKDPKLYPRPIDAIEKRQRTAARHAALEVQNERIKAREGT
jgi:hypothetical protein